MPLYLHETKARAKREFVPLDSNNVTIYVCGPTVYDYVHIGNGRPYVVFDVLVRLLRTKYPSVRYARNITDIEDKIIAAAAAAGVTTEELTETYRAAYLDNMSSLGVLPPDIEPWATEHISQIHGMINTLIERGNAYVAEQHVLFHVPSDPNYGSLSGRTLDEMLDGARVEVAPYKRDAKDFVLWKPSTPDLPGWESPWGRGRPGWHIECSAMIRAHLGTSIDIHGAGSDLIFPHNENEIAQSTCIGDDPEFVRYWVHNGMMTIDGVKMSKSLGNVVTINKLLEQYRGETLRYALMSGHYRQNLDWNERLLVQSERSLRSLYNALRHVPECSSSTSADYQQLSESEFPDPVVEALNDDLNTPRALAALHATATEIHSSTDAQQRRELGTSLLAGGWLLGLFSQTAEEYFQSGQAIDQEVIESLIEERANARSRGDYEQADRIRQQLIDEGIELEDTRVGTTWRIR